MPTACRFRQPSPTAFERAAGDGSSRRLGLFQSPGRVAIAVDHGSANLQFATRARLVQRIAGRRPARIGVTGASGGGTQTILLGAIDPRPAVFFPAVMVSTAMQGGCTCENCNYLRIGSGNIEFAAMAAPRPLGMTAADDWTKELDAKGYPELKRHYALFNAEKSVMAKTLLQFPHNFNYVSRAVMYRWMNDHLNLGLENPIVEEDFKPLSIAEMSVWDKDHPRPMGGDDFERSLCSASRPTPTSNLRHYNRRTKSRRSNFAASWAELLRR